MGRALAWHVANFKSKHVTVLSKMVLCVVYRSGALIPFCSIVKCRTHPFKQGFDQGPLLSFGGDTCLKNPKKNQKQ